MFEVAMLYFKTIMHKIHTQHDSLIAGNNKIDVCNGHNVNLTFVQNDKFDVISIIKRCNDYDFVIQFH